MSFGVPRVRHQKNVNTKLYRQCVSVFSDVLFVSCCSLLNGSAPKQHLHVLFVYQTSWDCVGEASTQDLPSIVWLVGPHWTLNTGGFAHKPDRSSQIDRTQTLPKCGHVFVHKTADLTSSLSLPKAAHLVARKLIWAVSVPSLRG